MDVLDEKQITKLVEAASKHYVDDPKLGDSLGRSYTYLIHETEKCVRERICCEPTDEQLEIAAKIRYGGGWDGVPKQTRENLKGALRQALATAGIPGVVRLDVTPEQVDAAAKEYVSQFPYGNATHKAKAILTAAVAAAKPVGPLSEGWLDVVRNERDDWKQRAETAEARLADRRTTENNRALAAKTALGACERDRDEWKRLTEEGTARYIEALDQVKELEGRLARKEAEVGRADKRIAALESALSDAIPWIGEPRNGPSWAMEGAIDINRRACEAALARAVALFPDGYVSLAHPAPKPAPQPVGDDQPMTIGMM